MRDDVGFNVYRNFNAEVSKAVEKTITNVLGPQVLNSLYGFLIQQHDVAKDELPCRLEPLSDTLEVTFGSKGSRTISRVIAREVYDKMGLKFVEMSDYGLTHYIELARKQLE